MAFPTPTSIGETYFDSSSGRRWICSSLNPVVWSVDKSATLIVGPGGLSSSGFSQFGNGVKISGGLTAIGNVAISGNLTVGGAVITTLSEVVQIEDNIIQLNSNATVGASGGIEMYRGGNGSRYILWDEDLDKWRFTNDGVNYVDLGAALSLPIATASITGVAAFPNVDFSVSPFGVVSLTGNVARTIIGQTFTGLQVFSSGLSANGLTGTLMTAAQPNITSVGILNGLSVNNGLSVTGGISITGGEQVFGGSRIQSGGLSVTGGIAGTILTPSQTNITAVGVLNGLSVNNGLSVTGSMTVTGGLFAFGGIAGVITSATPAQPNITSLGSLVALNTAGITSTQRVTISSGGLSVAGNIDGTIGTAAQPNITSLGTLTSLNTAGLTSSQTVNITNGGLSAAGPVFIQSNGLSVTGGIAGTILTPSQTNITAVGTLTSLNTAGLTSSERVNITNGGLSASGPVFIQSNGLSVTGGIAGTILTASQTNITAVGSLTSLNTAGITSSQRVNVSAGGLVVQAGGLSVTGGANVTGGSFFYGDIEVFDGAFVRSGGLSVTGGANITGGAIIGGGGLSVTGGIAGTILTASQTNITAVGSLVSLNTAGITSSERVNVSSGGIVVQAGGLSVTGSANVTGGAIIAGGLTSLGQIFVVAGQTANFFGSIVVSGNNIGIPDLTYETNAGITWPLSSVPTYTLGDRWTNGANEYTWVGNAWVEINNAVSSAPFDSIPDGSVTPAKLSTGKPTWDSAGTVYVSNGLNVTGGQFIRTGGLSVTGGFAGTILTPSQTNITSVGVLNGLSVNNGLSVTGGISITGGINVGGGGLSVTGGVISNQGLTSGTLGATLTRKDYVDSFAPKAFVGVSVNGSTVTLKKYFYNGFTGAAPTVSYVSTGVYRVTFPSGLFADTDYFPVLSVNDTNGNDTWYSCHVDSTTQITIVTGFVGGTSQGLKNINGQIRLVIYY